MALASVNCFGFKQIFKFQKILVVNNVKNLYTKVSPLTVTSSNAQKIFDEQLKKMQECKEESEKFKYGFNVAKEILSDKEISFNSSLVAGKINELIEHNAQQGRYKRTEIFLKAYESLAPAEKLSGKYLLQAYSMAWIHQLIMSAGIILDDILDDSEIRRNNITWHKKVGKIASNDPLLLCSGTYVLMKNLFEKEPYFLPCLNVLYETFWWMGGSLCLDHYTLNIMTKDASLCNWDVHRDLHTSIIGTTSIQAPLFTAFHMAGHNFDYMRNELIEICALMGHIIKDKNDYIDRYSKTYRKTSDEDIKLGKLTWFLLTALEQSNEGQKKILKECYGKNKPDCTNAVVDIYDQLKLEEQYFEHEKQLIDFTTRRVNKIPDENIRKIFTDCMHTSVNWYND